jgi:hypothetical protein
MPVRDFTIRSSSRSNLGSGLRAAVEGGATPSVLTKSDFENFQRLESKKRFAFKSSREGFFLAAFLLSNFPFRWIPIIGSNQRRGEVERESHGG